MKTKKIVFLAILVAQALVLSILESFIPVPVSLPGIKLGLSNIIIIIAILHFSKKDVLTLVLIKSILGAVFAGVPMTFFFSVSGGILSFIIMKILISFKKDTFSLTGISVVGAVFHNIGQVLIAMTIMNDPVIVLYLPILLISGVVMGVFVGISSTFLENAIQKTGIFRTFERINL